MHCVCLLQVHSAGRGYVYAIGGNRTAADTVSVTQIPEPECSLCSLVCQHHHAEQHPIQERHNASAQTVCTGQGHSLLLLCCFPLSQNAGQTADLLLTRLCIVLVKLASDASDMSNYVNCGEHGSSLQLFVDSVH